MDNKHLQELEFEVGAKVKHIERGILGTIVKKRVHEVIKIREENLEEEKP